MVPTVKWIICHFTSNFLEGTSVFMESVEKLAIAIITTFHLSKDVLWWRMTILMVEIDDVMNIVHVHNEPPHLLWDFALSFSKSEDSRRG